MTEKDGREKEKLEKLERRLQEVFYTLQNKKYAFSNN